MREVRAHVRHAQHVHQELRELVGPRAGPRHGRGQRRVTGPMRDQGVLVPRTPGARPARRDDRVVPVEGRDEGAQRPDRLVEVAGVDHRLPAARLRLREVHLDAESAQQRDDRAPDVREERVVDAGDHQCDLHDVTLIGRLAWVDPQPRGVNRARSWVRATRSRRSPRVGPTSPGRARLDEHVAEGRRLDRARQHGQARAIGDRLAEQGVLSAAADDVHHADRATGELGRPFAAAAAMAAAMLSTMHADHGHATARRQRRRARQHQAPMRACACRPGGRNRGSCDVERSAPARRTARPRAAGRRSRSAFAPGPAASRSAARCPSRCCRNRTVRRRRPRW